MNNQKSEKSIPWIVVNVWSLLLAGLAVLAVVWVAIKLVFEKIIGGGILNILNALVTVCVLVLISYIVVKIVSGRIIIPSNKIAKISIWVMLVMVTLHVVLLVFVFPKLSSVSLVWIVEIAMVDIFLFIITRHWFKEMSAESTGNSKARLIRLVLVSFVVMAAMLVIVERQIDKGKDVVINDKQNDAMVMSEKTEAKDVVLDFYSCCIRASRSKLELEKCYHSGVLRESLKTYFLSDDNMAYLLDDEYNEVAFNTVRQVRDNNTRNYTWVDSEIIEENISEDQASVIISFPSVYNGGRPHLIRVLLSTIGGEWKIRSIQNFALYTPVPAGIIKKHNIVIKTNIIEEEQKLPASMTYKIYIEMPEVSGLQNKDTQQKANEKINEHISGIISEFKQDSETRMAFLGQGGENKLEIRYTVVLLTDSIFSVLYSKTTDGIGAGHTYAGVTVFNYNFANNEQIELVDLFFVKIDYLDFVSQFAISDLIKQGISEGNIIKMGAGPEAENFENFVLSQDSIIIYFNPYQVASYGAGVQKVVIPYNELEGIFSTKVFDERLK